ncbi:MAG: hypothetical protein WCW47_00505 [Candidatus Paceibacterota bacterium]|jgi:hypothetical protein
MNQLTKPIGEYVERIVRDKNGQLVRATFCVYECDGHIKARLINAEIINEYLQKTEILKLGGLTAKWVRNYVEYVGATISPYFSLNTLYFSGSKPRAPTI